MNELPGGLDPAARAAQARANIENNPMQSTDLADRAGDGAGCPARIFPLRRPEGHKAPIPRYSAVLPQQDKVAVLFMGVQATDAEALREAEFAELLGANADPTPVYVDFATFADPQGYLNHVAALYWLKAKDFTTWSKLPAVAAWRARVASLSSVGLWWEPVAVDADYMETIAFKEFLRGFSGCPVSGLATTEGTGYWGAARDRIPAAAYDLFEPAVVASEPQGDASKIPYRSIQPPKNMAVIRSGVSWEHCEGEQLKDYQSRIKPALDAGMDYLRNNPRDTGCFALRQVNCVSGAGDELAEAYSLGAFVSLGHLESWAKDHPSHLAIYTRAMAARHKYQDQLQLRTYNEIFIVEENNPPFEYFNCHSRTGLLPYSQMLASAGA
jgi:aldoxime dehydratase